MATQSQKDVDYTSYYRLSRSFAGSARLTLQHYLWKLQFGWCLHPATYASYTASSSASEFRVADVACGNGIWSLEQLIPVSIPGQQVAVTGFDISDQQFPPVKTWPRNVEFKLWNFYDPVPDQYYEYFDVVHVRLVVAALPDGNPAPVLKNLLRMLKPSGYLQWDETDVAGTIADDDANLVRRLMERLTKEYFSLSSREWISKLDVTFRETGLQEVEILSDYPPEFLNKHWWDNYYMLFLEFAERSEDEGLDDFFKDVVKDITDSGKFPAWRNQVVIGKKQVA